MQKSNFCSWKKREYFFLPPQNASFNLEHLHNDIPIIEESREKYVENAVQFHFYAFPSSPWLKVPPSALKDMSSNLGVQLRCHQIVNTGECVRCSNAFIMMCNEPQAPFVDTKCVSIFGVNGCQNQQAHALPRAFFPIFLVILMIVMFIEASNKTTTTTFLCPLQNEAGTFL